MCNQIKNKYVNMLPIILSIAIVFSSFSFSLVPTASAVEVLPAPQNIRVTAVTHQTITLAFDPVVGVDEDGGYQIWYSNGGWAAWTSETKATIGGLNPNTSYSFYITAINAANDRSAIVIGKTASSNNPPIGSFTIDEGAATNVSTVNLSVTGSDPDAGQSVTHMRFANSDTNLSAASWLPFSSTAMFILVGGDGLKTIYMQLKDSWGGISANSSQTIFLDQTAPVVTGVANGGLYNTPQTITFDEGTGSLDGKPFTSGSTVSAGGTYTLVVTDAVGNRTMVTFTIDITPPQDSMISPGTRSFDKNTSAQADVMTTIRLNGNTLTGIANGVTQLTNGTDYSFDGNTLTILKKYLAGQPVGKTNLTFTFSGGSMQILSITVRDTTPRPSPPPYNPEASIPDTQTFTGENINGGKLRLKVSDINFLKDVTAEHFTLQNAPKGLTISEVKLISPWEVELTLAFDGRPLEQDYNFSLLIRSAALTSYSDITVNNAIQVNKSDITFKTIAKGELYEPTKVWTVKLSSEIDVSTLDGALYMIDIEGNLVPTILTSDGKNIFIAPPVDHYMEGTYTLYIMPSLKSKGGINLKEPIKMTFIIK